jgi:flagellar biosynthesis protein FlhF
MHIRTFRAESLQDALEEIRRQMGNDASVLHTRQVRDGWMGWLGRTSVEVTAGLRDQNSPVLRVAEEVEIAPSRTPRYPMELQDLRTMLTLAGVDELAAERWIAETHAFGISLPGGAGSGSWGELLKRTVSRGIKIGKPIQAPMGERRIVALVGPTGVGKTTTIAKLAAGFRLADVDLVLIDTAGRSPRSDARIAQLSGILAAAAPDETHLVVSATSSRETIANILEGFSPVRPTSLILTKLDETVQTAGPLSAIEGHGIPINYVTDGQHVPDDIQVADPQMLVQSLLTHHLSNSNLSGFMGQHRAA